MFVNKQTSKQKKEKGFYIESFITAQGDWVYRCLAENGISNNKNEAEEFEGQISKAEGLEGA